MTWICPTCGYENRKDPLNGRHRHNILCHGCNDVMRSPEEVEAERAERIKNLETDLRRAKWGMLPIIERLSSYRQEVIDAERELAEQKQGVAGIQASIDILKSKPIFREVDRDAKVALDIHQVKLPFEGAGVTC